MLISVTWLLSLGFIVTASPTVQYPFSSSAVEWTTLGPFPLGSREGPLLPPLLPDLALNRHPSPLADGGFVHARVVKDDSDGWVKVGDSAVRWNALRATSGWSVLQHQVYYERDLPIDSPGLFSFALDGAAEFSLLQAGANPVERRWYHGNMYSYPDAVPHLVELQRGVWKLTVTNSHDIRIAGEPEKDGVPRGKWRLRVKKEKERLVLTSIAAPSFFEGRLMGTVLGLQLSSRVHSSAVVKSARALTGSFGVSLSAPISIAPLQTRPIALILSQERPLKSIRNSFSFDVQLVVALGDHVINLTTTVDLSVSHSSSSQPAALISTFLSNSGSPSYALYTPPTDARAGCSPVALLALHGAGVEVAADSSWTTSITPRKREWIVWPSGLTPWGYDWHGASLSDVNASVAHLEEVKRRWGEAIGAECSSSPTQKLIVLGHSNGGQGAYHFMSHYPDRVLGGIPTSGYVKIQEYVPYHLSDGQHFRDPALTGILTSALSSFDNDLYASNLAGSPILSRHGGDDDNVPVQHSRQMIALIDKWSNGSSKAEYSEVKGAGHWFNGVLSAPVVDNFIDRLLSPKVPLPGPRTIRFTLTTANPDESGSKEGIRIVSLATPGRLARIEVEIFDSLTSTGAVTITTTNVCAFEVDAAVMREQLGFQPGSLIVNGGPATSLDLERSSMFNLTSQGVLSSTASAARRYGPLISILNTPRPLLIVVGTNGSPSMTQHLTSIAQRIARDAWLYGKVDSQIIKDEEVDEIGAREGNVALLGDSFSNSLTASWAERWPIPVSFVAPEAFRVGEHLFGTAGHGLLSLTPHPTQPSSLVLVLAGVGAEGLERAARLFPVRTGVPLPDWVVSSPSTTSGGIAAAGFWGAEWGWNDKASFP